MFLYESEEKTWQNLSSREQMENYSAVRVVCRLIDGIRRCRL